MREAQLGMLNLQSMNILHARRAIRLQLPLAHPKHELDGPEVLA